MATTLESPSRVTAPVAAAPVPPRRPWRPVAVLVVLAWAVPGTTHLLGIDWLLPPLVLVATASLLRVGRTLLDRLMLALCLLLGTTCAAGLFLSVWPWRLQPAPVAILALTVLAVLAAVTGRRPRLPVPSLADLVTVCAAIAVAGYLARPYLRSDFAGRLGYAMNGEDLLRHLTVFDGIRWTGGYLFLHPASAGRYVYSGMIYYPQGSHFWYALLDGYLPGPAADPVRGFDHLIGFHVLGYGLLTLSILWSARWLGGRLLGSAWRWLPVTVLLALLCAYGDLVADFVMGYPSEILGLALVVLLVALLARPVAAGRTQILVVGSLLVALGFTYYLFLPGLAVAAAVSVLRHRRPFALVTGLVSAGLALTPPLIGVLAGGQAAAVNASGGLRNSRDALLALALLVAAALASAAGRRSPVWRAYRWPLASVLGYVAVLGGYQRLVHGGTGYYFEKSLHCVEVLLLVGLGALTMFLPSPLRTPGGRARALPALLVVGAIAAGLGLVRGDAPYHPLLNPGAGNWGHAWVAGLLNQPARGRLAARIIRQYPTPPGGATLVLTDDAYDNYVLSLFVAAVEGRSGPPISRAFYVGHLPMTSAADIRTMMVAVRAPITAVVTSRRLLPVVRQIQATEPGVRVTVVDLSAQHSGSAVAG